MKKAHLSLGSMFAFVSGSLFAAGEAQAALTFETGNIQCGVSKDIVIDLVNDTTQTVVGGKAFLGIIYVGTFSTIAPGATTSIEVSSPNAWSCTGNTTSLRLKTPSHNMTILGYRETTMARIQLDTLSGSSSHIHVEGDPFTQYRTCDEADSDYWVETWVTFPFLSGSKEYRFTGGLESPWFNLDTSLAHHDRLLRFWFADDVCPSTTTPFVLTVDSSAGTDTSEGTVSPHWEVVSGSYAP
jgi:hypothetical protein